MASRPLILGIDPGRKGAYALYDYERKQMIVVDSMPSLSLSTAIDIVKLETHLWFYKEKIKFAVIEDPWGMPNDGPSQAFKFGYACGLVNGLCAGFQIPVYQVFPATWKIMMGLTHDKNLSISKAIKNFPEVKDKFKRKMDDGRAEAALLAYFGSKNLL